LNRPLFPFLLGSQSMYSTCADYARLLCLWADDGVAPGGHRLLSPGAIRRGLTPVSAMEYPTMLRGVAPRYGQMWMLWTSQPPHQPAGQRPGEPPAASQPDPDMVQPTEEVIVFGHGGSDGTCGWMWPQRDLIVLYFTQSRGGLSALKIEEAIDRTLIQDNQTTAAALALTPEEMAELAGVYWTGNDRYWAIWPVEGQTRLRLEIQGRTVVDLVPTDARAPGMWRIEISPDTWVKFQREGEGRRGRAIAVEVGNARGSERYRRLEPEPGLPTADELCARVAEAHGLAKIQRAVRRTGTLSMPAQKIDGAYSVLLSRDRALTEMHVRGSITRVLATPEGAWSRAGDNPAEKMTGALAEQTLLDQPTFVFGDWRSRVSTIGVLTRVQRDGKPALLVRIVPREAYPGSFLIDEQTGRVVESSRVGNIGGLGAIGAVTVYSDFETVAGATLPRHVVTTYATPLLGVAEVKFEQQVAADDVDPDKGFSIE